MPTVCVWPPEGDDSYGHVALKTDLYYISFWPNGTLSGKNKQSLRNAVKILFSMEGCLFLNQNVDFEYEDECDPIEYSIGATVSNENINSVYEEFLRYNNINPEDVTLDRGEEFFRKYQEEPELSQKSLPKTQYSFSVELMSGSEKEFSLPFYHKQQSCVSFIFNLVQTALLKYHPDRHIPIVIPEDFIAVTDTRGSNYMDFPYKVLWFEEQVVKKYLTEDASISTIATTAIEKPTIIVSEHYLAMAFWAVSFSILAYLWKNYPDLRYYVVIAAFFNFENPLMTFDRSTVVTLINWAISTFLWKLFSVELVYVTITLVFHAFFYYYEGVLEFNRLYGGHIFWHIMTVAKRSGSRNLKFFKRYSPF